MEDLVTAPTQVELVRAYEGKRAFVTGHTGFKGGWLALWLERLGARVTGYALAPDTEPSLFAAADVARGVRSVLADVRDLGALRAALREAQPDFVFHLAAQPLVRRSYAEPLETLQTNVVGTANVLEAVRQEKLRCAIVVVTSDKAYENREWDHGYREDDAMGGHDVYSMSKGAAELVIASWRRSFFPVAQLADHGVALASARAGNVIGGGDWGPERIMTDAVRALAAGRPIPVRNPDSVRPWQHVLEPVGGYLLLGARLASAPAAHAEAWNFGPRVDAARPVRQLVDALVAAWGSGSWEDRREPNAPHEAKLLRLSIEKSVARLGWAPRWDLDEAVRRTAAWYLAHHRGAGPDAMRALCFAQIHEYVTA